mgnify:CR=1 FL=1
MKMKMKIYHGTNWKWSGEEGDTFWADPMFFCTDNFEVARFYGAMRAIEQVMNEGIDTEEARFYVYEFEVEIDDNRLYSFSDRERRWIYTRWIDEYLRRNDLLEKIQWVHIRHDEIQASRRKNTLLEALDMTYGNVEMSILVEELFESLPIHSNEYVCVDPKMDLIPTRVHEFRLSNIKEEI